MTELVVIGAGVAAVSGSATDKDWQSLAAAFKKRTRQRYIDPAAELGIKALADAIGGDRSMQDAIEANPARFGILIATRSGPAKTREQFLDSYADRGGKSASATLFSNCGYNIVGAMLARFGNIRGPVLTFDAAGETWVRRLLGIARSLIAADRVDVLFVGRVEADEALLLALAAGRPGMPLPVSAIDDEAALRRMAVKWREQHGAVLAAATGGCAT